METTSKAISEELYKLSGWDKSDDGKYIRYAYCTDFDHPVERYKILEEMLVCPAYSLGFLLRKLPRDIMIDSEITFFALERSGIADWRAGYWGQSRPEGQNKRLMFDKSVEDCVAKLAIELIKEGVIK